VPTKKKRRRPASRPAPGGSSTARPAKPAAPSTRERRERKEEARRARERARKQVRRRALVRRTATLTVGAAAVFLIVAFVYRAASPKPLSQAARTAAAAAGCSAVETPIAGEPSRQHLTPGASYDYPSEPATAGPHDPSPLPDEPHVYTEMPPETNLVHNLEHAFVNLYYRQTGDGALPQDVVDALTTFANAHTRTILSPHTSLPDGVALAYTAWDKLITCPAGITATQARTIAQGWWDSYACSSNAPEAPPRYAC
jgi:hypothetical protein